MSDIAIRVENLSKQYRIGGPSTAPSAMLRTRLRTGKRERYKTLRDTLADAVTGPFRRLSSVVRGQSSAVSNETIWALKDVSFEVERGEVVGIIGRNGAGKTTLTSTGSVQGSRSSPVSRSRRRAAPRCTAGWALCWR